MTSSGFQENAKAPQNLLWKDGWGKWHVSKVFCRDVQQVCVSKGDSRDLLRPKKNWVKKWIMFQMFKEAGFHAFLVPDLTDRVVGPAVSSMSWVLYYCDLSLRKRLARILRSHVPRT